MVLVTVSIAKIIPLSPLQMEPNHLTCFQVISGDATAAEVRQTLTGLEKALKKEGLFKNVKSGFIHLKKEFLSVSIGKTLPNKKKLQ